MSILEAEQSGRRGEPSLRLDHRPRDLVVRGTVPLVEEEPAARALEGRDLDQRALGALLVRQGPRRYHPCPARKRPQSVRPHTLTAQFAHFDRTVRTL